MTISLFAAAAADLTIERIRALAARPEQVESLTLEFKREYSKSLLTTIAAMANTYGGMILVGMAAIRLSLPRSAGASFPPGLKAGVSTKETR
ncbi:ATP-binding protein [Streptomyces sp. NPDC005727]|uniref:AlbA family DNA-binding domain-containing protein n=1 Tax=Streptomyces sp. NPDC005727 TaxID=3157053 RepID=UPI0033C91E84